MSAPCPACGMLPEAHHEGNASCYNFPKLRQRAQEEWVSKVAAGCLAIVAEGEQGDDFPAVAVERKYEVRQLCDRTRGWLVEQCFWAYPPPYVEENSSAYQHAAGVMVPTDAAWELYRRYKYGGKGRESRRWFRDFARRQAAKYMVKTFLLLKEKR